MTVSPVRLSGQRRQLPSRLVTGTLAVVLGAFLACEAVAELPGEGVSVEEAAEGFESLFDGKTLAGWNGSGWSVEDGAMVCHGGFLTYAGGDLANFVLRFEVKLSPGANNGFNFRSDGRFWNELQVIDDTDPLNRDLKPYQTHAPLWRGCGATRAPRGRAEWICGESLADGTNICGHAQRGARGFRTSILATLDCQSHCHWDGQRTAPGSATEVRPDRLAGPCQCQGEPGDVSFRRLRLKRLP